ncbi:MAG TPA: SDR family oxidoreductase [Pyrinomonadaceae bacterium]|jgi:nucleoside-diphosphate-sugar epimerase
MKVFLTGASGYVGSVVAEKLKNKGYKVTGLARSDAAETKLSERKITPVRGDLQDFEVLKKAASEADAVIHTAFSHNFSDYSDAAKLDRNVIAAFAESLARTNKPFIVTSSSAILGDTRSNQADEDYPFDQNSTRLLRGETERDVLQLSSKGIRGVVLRLPLFVYGRGGSSFVPFMIRQAKEAGAANYVETGEQKVSAVHVEDAADLYALAMETSTAKGLYNVASESVSLRDLNESIARLLNVKAQSISKEKAKETFGKMFDFLAINNQLSAEKAERELGWRANANKTILDDIENGSYRNFKE